MIMIHPGFGSLSALIGASPAAIFRCFFVRERAVGDKLRRAIKCLNSEEGQCGSASPKLLASRPCLHVQGFLFTFAFSFFLSYTLWSFCESPSTLNISINSRFAFCVRIDLDFFFLPVRTFLFFFIPVFYNRIPQSSGVINGRQY